MTARSRRGPGPVPTALLLRLALFLLLGWALSLALLQLMLGRRLERAQIQQLGRDLASGILLSEVALERFPPSVVSQLGNLRLASGPLAPSPVPEAQQQQSRELTVAR